MAGDRRPSWPAPSSIGVQQTETIHLTGLRAEQPENRFPVHGMNKHLSLHHSLYIPALRPIQRVPVVKRPGREADH
jgi:hypothetical protein